VVKPKEISGDVTAPSSLPAKVTYFISTCPLC
jgi:hypothetical protein